MIESLTVLADGSLLGRLARDPGHNLGRVLGKVRFRDLAEAIDELAPTPDEAADGCGEGDQGCCPPIGGRP